MIRNQTINGIRIRSHLDDVREFTKEAPKYVGRWGRADSIYNWMGTVVRLKRHHWTGERAIPWGIVIEVGPSSWLSALWTDGTDPSETIAPRDIDRWWPPHIHSLKQEMLGRRISEEQLIDLLRGLDYPNLTRVR